MTPMQTRFAAETEPWKTGDHRQRVAAKRRQRMRSLLLNSAMRLMLENSASTPSIDDIISAAGVSRGTFYKYFPSSDAIVRELVGKIAEQWVRAADPIVRDHDDPAEHIARGIRLASILTVHQPGVAGILGRLGWAGYQAPNMLEFVRRDIEEGVRLNRFKRMPIALGFNIVAGAAMSAMQSMLDTECREDFSELAAAVALRALGVEESAADAISRSPLHASEALFDGLLAETISDVP